MTYPSNLEPDELTALTALDVGDVFVVGDISDAAEPAKHITKTNLITDLTTSFATTGHNHTGVYAPALGADDNYVTDAEKVVIGNTSGTNTGDNAVNSNYSGLVTNATHTGDAEGATSLTVKRINGTALSGLATGVLKNTTTTGVPFISKVAITEPATASTLTIADGQTLTVNGSATITNGTHSGTNTGDNTVATALTGTPSITVATVTTTGNIELGHASQTTLSGSAGVLSVEGNAVLTEATGLPLAGGTMTGNITLSANSSISLTQSGNVNGKYTGITTAGTAGYAQTVGDLVYLDPTDSRWEKTDANSASAADGDARGMLGIVVVAGAADGNACTILLNGTFCATARTWTVNNPIYVSETAGDMTQTQPTATDVVIRIVGSALSADEMYFNPDWAWVTHT